VAKPNAIELRDGRTIPIFYENRSVLAIDKPPGYDKL
jgi:23S rRNA-/tRNA-specific pseudouridylate synthase